MLFKFVARKEMAHIKSLAINLEIMRYGIINI